MDAPVASEQPPALTMLARTTPDSVWFSREECDGLSAEMEVDVRAARVCSTPRSKPPAWHARLHHANRLVVAIDPQLQTHMLDQLPEDRVASRSSELPPLRRGICIYYVAGPRVARRGWHFDIPDAFPAVRRTPTEASPVGIG